MAETMAQVHRQRSAELRLIDPAQRETWLAEQVDEVEAVALAAVETLGLEAGRLRDEMVALRKVLTGLLVSIIVALVGGGIGLIVGVLTRGG